VQDLASTNGTLLNDAIISMPTVITSGDEIKCGKARLLVNISVDVFVSPTIRVEKENK
jgi:pSer/pThr/pTyr-binding forkhead associated (FHA) protein